MLCIPITSIPASLLSHTQTSHPLNSPMQSLYYKLPAHLFHTLFHIVHQPYALIASIQLTIITPTNRPCIKNSITFHITHCHTYPFITFIRSPQNFYVIISSCTNLYRNSICITHTQSPICVACTCQPLNASV